MMNKLKLFLVLFFPLLLPLTITAQMEDPVHFGVSQKRVSPTEILLTFTGTIDEGWHVYSSNIPAGGPTAASFKLTKATGIKVKGKLQPGSGAKSGFDKIFQMSISFFEKHASFNQMLEITSQNYSANGVLEYGACNDENCLPPSEVPFSIKGSDGPIAKEKNQADSVATTNEALANPTDSLSANTSGIPSYWQPVAAQMKAFGGTSTGESLWVIFLLGLLGGLIAVVTPCVWPIIPMTVSFFLKRSDKNRSKSIRDAILYGFSIILIYVSVGFLVTLWKGGNALNALSTSAVFNLICFAILVFFAASFLGGFEIQLPTSWGNKTDQKAEKKSGFAGIFLMALTLVIVSFSCTGPIIGFLLVDISTHASYIAPLTGMFGFALALALPFTLFALFPSLMKKAPKSGGWMNTVKVVLGFIELAFSLKFLSVADMAYGWGILSRETFLSLWIVLFALLGIYLLGKLKFPGEGKSDHTTIPGFFLGLVSLAFAVYMLPGLWGAPLNAISAFAPPMTTQDFNLGNDQVEAQFNDLEPAIEESRKTGKPIFIDFTGYGCVNCRKMEAAVWSNPQVAKILKEDFILVSLYVDDRTPLSQPMKVNINGQEKELTTVGQKWSFLQSYKFGANTQPFYIPVNAEGKALNHSYSYDEDVDKYLEFLKESSRNNLHQ